MKATAELIKNIVQGFDPSDTIKSFVDNLDGTFTITLCNVFHARPGSIIKVNNIEYTVIEVTETTIKYKSLIAPVIGQIYKPPIMHFFNGTPFATGAELSEIGNHKDKLPLFYLYEIIEDEMIEDIGSSIERKSDLRFFIMDWADYAGWQTSKHYSDAITPMLKYWVAFKTYLKRKSIIGLLPNYKLIYHAKFGISINQNGHVKQLFADELSGIEIRIILPIEKDFVCSCS